MPRTFLLAAAASFLYIYILFFSFLNSDEQQTNTAQTTDC